MKQTTSYFLQGQFLRMETAKDIDIAWAFYHAVDPNPALFNLIILENLW